jgi:nucleotide-binding universal stress UspA family protein
LQSILLHIFDDTGFESRLQAALDLARAFRGHITCLHATPLEEYLKVDPWVAARLPEEFSEKMKARRLALQAKVEIRLKGEGVEWDWLHLDDTMTRALVRYSIMFDVIVVTLARHAFEQDEPRTLAAAVATGARTPVLAVPEADERLRLDAPVVLAWNGSPEAAAAMRAALPVLRLSSAVHLLEVEDKLAPYPRDLAAKYLSRHGVHVEIAQRRPIAGSVSEAITTSALELGAGLIVMGAYGHSRLREFLLGGVTQDLIFDSRIPLLLAH